MQAPPPLPGLPALRRRLLLLGAGAAGLARPALAQTPWPDRPIRLVIGFTPGGTNDIVGRLVTEAMAPLLGAGFVIENRAGAGGMLAADLVAKAAPDGNTLLLGGSGGLTIPSLVHARLPFDIDTAFAPVGMIGAAPNVIIVQPGLAVRSLAELQAFAKARRGPLTYGSPGVGSTGHPAGALVAQALGIEMEHVPYRGTAPALTDLVAGRIDVFVNALAPLLPFIQDGRVRALAIAGGRRAQSLPDLPTTAEAGFPAILAATWWGLFAPAGTPTERITRLHAALNRALALPEVRRRLAEGGVEVEASESPAAFARDFAADRIRWAPVMQAAGIRVE